MVFGAEVTSQMVQCCLSPVSVHSANAVASRDAGFAVADNVSAGRRRDVWRCCRGSAPTAPGKQRLLHCRQLFFTLPCATGWRWFEFLF